MAFATKEDLEKVMVEIESIKIRMIDHTQQMTDKMNTLSEKIESDQAGMKDSHTRLVLNFNELQGKVNEMGIKCNSMNDTRSQPRGHERGG